MKRFSKETFVAMAKAVHGENAFDYKDVVYVNSHTPVVLTCNTCGRTFNQLPQSHLRGIGCASCSHSGSSWTVEMFVKAAQKVHGDKYKYDTITDFKNMHTKVSIFCPTHGIFKQTPRMHLNGQGCPQCWKERRKRGVLGVGVNDYQGNVFEDKEILKSYNVWHLMLSRCYDKNQETRNPSYKGCTVCEEWLHFSNFKRWFDDPANGYQDGYCLDKDILVSGNRVYSPDTCCFIPNELNVLFRPKEKKRDLPKGVYRLKSGLFEVSFGNKYIGSFGSVDVAYKAYCDCKTSHIKSIAQSYFSENKITKKVYNALMKFDVEQYNKL